MPDDDLSMDMPEGVSDLDVLNQGDDNEEENEEGEEGESEDEGLSERKVSKGSKKSKVNSEENEEADEDEESDEDSSDEDEDSEDGDEEEVEDEDDEEDEEVEETDLNKGLKKKFPEIFKTFPQLREIIKTEEAYSKLFVSPQHAEIAANKSNILDHMAADIVSGDVDKTQRFLKAIENNSPDGYKDFAHTVITAIGKKDPELYGEILRVPIKRALQTLYAEGLKFKNKNMAASAIYAHEYFFGNQDIKGELEERKKPEKSKEQEAWEREKQQIQTQAAREFDSSVSDAVSHSLRNAIRRQLEGYEIDSYKLRNIIRDISSEVDELLGQDKRHLSGMDALFAKARSSKFSEQSKSEIIRAYLTRARLSLPAVRNKVLKEAGIKVKSEKKENRRIVPAGLGGGKGGEIDFSRVDKSRTSDADILSGDPKRIKYLK